MGFESLNTQYEDDSNFGDARRVCKEPCVGNWMSYLDYFIQNGYLFKKDHLCITRGSTRDNMIQELNDGGHSNSDKMLAKVDENYSQLGMSKGIDKFVKTCQTCQRTKVVSQNSSLYQLLLLTKGLWEVTSMDFVNRIVRTHKGFNSIFVVVDKVSKLAQFVTCKEASDATHVVELLHGLPKRIKSNENTRLLSHLQ